ncbi:MAG: 16S rRNA (cytosine(1402)-N(4))-methyltransferase RsmH [Rhodobacteraceae bacterium]|nr:16S rRNA (cytosine(1402)-N(4))-methyltransferase RsmH [Paracoccaceae bacterium]
MAEAGRAHVPVLLEPLLAAVAPVSGVWLDGTFGAGGYARALLEAGAERVIAIDRDRQALERARAWAGLYADRLVLLEGRFSQLDTLARAAGAEPLSGVVLDIGVSSMQIDEAERGFSFLRDGPLDMRMGGEGPSAADIVASADERELADILFQYGEERASRRIARAILAARSSAPIETTARLAEVIAAALPPARPGEAHPATRSFQALRIAVNDELAELVAGLLAAETALAPGGMLAVVTFHSLEDRIVKRFFQARAGEAPRASRHAPDAPAARPVLERVTRRAITADAEEVSRNPRARSARLRVARRLEGPAPALAPAALGLPRLARGEVR